MRVFDLYLEPLEERYTEQWMRWFKEEFMKERIEHFQIPYGRIPEALCKEIKLGAFLDVNSTMDWKARQVEHIARLFHRCEIRDGDVFFIPDLWFPVEMLVYMIRLNRIKASIFAFLHAGSYTREDFIEPLADWARYMEAGWVRAVDGVFVGTEYHKKSFISRRMEPLMDDWRRVASKIHVTGNPFNHEEVIRRAGGIPARKKNQIIYPNRFDYEKRPNIFLDIAKIIRANNEDWAFLLTTSRPYLRSCHPWLEEYAKALEKEGTVVIKAGLTKDQYYKELAESKIMVSTSIEENFGYCAVEAIAVDTVPLVPDDYSYPELVPHPSMRYKDYSGLLDKLLWWMAELEKEKGYNFETLDKRRFDGSIDKMIEIMRKSQCVNEESER